MERLGIVIPCYNESEIFNFSNSCINKKLNELIEKNKISVDSFVLYVNDGSKDNTLDLLKKESNINPKVKYISLAKNFGQQGAILAGLNNVVDYADNIITMDMDLQDDINVIDSFIDEREKGNDIVFGVRNDRSTDRFLKRNLAQGFYKLMEKLGTGVVYNHAEYRLMSKKALKALLEYKERNIFIRGVVSNLGFKSTVVEYKRLDRKYGTSKYSFMKSYNLAKEGILSFSVTPLKLITRAAMVIILISTIYLIYALIGKITGGNVIGWTTIIALICLFNGFQTLCIGIIGEYIARIYNETKNRPLYIIDEMKID